ncbi:hypothetical protein Cgig2_011491 [Carnegiea gigantea]|uniref:Uncharacterized protein n=1 Tax=Carnegiea gigantea TaxID=171969 RepID=A0A9Q1GZ60_9CARY|nr:hypothetical protein Cgig2_011491 [Carnegiea gigantea]
MHNRLQLESHLHNGRQPWKLMEAKSVLFDSDCSSTLSVQAAMEGRSQSFGSPTSNSRICCPKCKVATELKYSISRSEKNFLRPYYASLKCGGFVCWAEQEGRGDSMGSHERGSINRGRQRVVGGPQGSVIIDLNDIIQLKEEVSCVKGEVVEMRSEIRSLLGKIYEAIKIVSAGLILYYLEMDALLHHIIPNNI